MLLFSSACHFLALSVFSDHLDLLLDDTPEFLLLMWHIRHFRFFRQFLAFFGIHQMALSLFRFIAAVGRTQVVANTLGTFTLLMVFVLGGFIISKSK